MTLVENMRECGTQSSYWRSSSGLRFEPRYYVHDGYWAILRFAETTVIWHDDAYWIITKLTTDVRYTSAPTDRGHCVFVVLSAEHRTKLQIVKSFSVVWVCATYKCLCVRLLLSVSYLFTGYWSDVRLAGLGLWAVVCVHTLFLSCVSTSPGPMCLSSRARALGEGCRVARWSGVISSKSFCSQLARLDRSSFRKRTFPCNTKIKTIVQRRSLENTKIF